MENVPSRDKIGKISQVDRYTKRLGNARAVGRMQFQPVTSTERTARNATAGDNVYDTDNNAPYFYNGSTWVEYGTSVGGEINTASNVGSGGVGVYKQKTGVNLEFKNVNAGSSKVTVTDDTGNNEIDIDVDDTQLDHNALTNTHNLTTDIDHDQLTNTHDLTTDIDHNQLANYTPSRHFLESSIDHTEIQNIGTNTHAQIDDHIASTSNPHSVDETDILPSQTGNSGKYLTTDGSDSSWAVVPDGDGGGITWSEVTGTSQSASVNSGYITNDALFGQVTVTLPSTASVGDIVRICGKGAGGWKLAQNSDQTIYFGNTSTTTGTGGYLESYHYGDCVEVVCITANDDWRVLSSQGNITVV